MSAGAASGNCSVRSLPTSPRSRSAKSRSARLCRVGARPPPPAPGAGTGRGRRPGEPPVAAPEPLAEGWMRVNERVERLMGFKADQFRQVVVLPQGMFQKLLLSDSKQREAILSVLFPDVERFGRIQ